MHGHSRDQNEHAQSRRPSSREQDFFDFLVRNYFSGLGLAQALFNLGEEAESFD